MDSLYSSIGESSCDNLIAGQDFPILSKTITIAKGQGILKRGTVLGIITASGFAKKVDSTQTDGTQTAKYILAGDVDTGDSSATSDVGAEVYETGLFNSKALIFGGTDTVNKHEDNLRMLGIYLKENISY